MTTLVIVPCHAVWNPIYESPTGISNYGQDPKSWYLASFQYEGKDHIAFIGHALTAIEYVVNHYSEEPVLLFSGSQTKRTAGYLSEAQSYYLLMRKLLNNSEGSCPLPAGINSFIDGIKTSLQQIGKKPDELFTEGTIALEEYALDSFDNVLLSLYRFKQLTGSYPENIVISGFQFKKERFLDYHIKAIDFSQNHVTYLGNKPTPSGDSQAVATYFQALQSAERKNALDLFAQDWYATKEPLASKKKSRNPFQRSNIYADVATLHLDHEINDDKQFFEQFVQGKMPWSPQMQPKAEKEHVASN